MSVRTKKYKYKHLITTITPLALIVIIISFFVFDSIRSRPLGEKVEYVGKQSFGSIFPPSSSLPYDVYYYDTNMSPEEIIAYFKKAQLTSAIKDGGTVKSFTLKMANDETIDLIVHNKSSEDTEAILKNTDKKYIFTVPSFKYDQLKASIE